MKNFKFSLKHDKGVLTLKVSSDSKLNAIKDTVRAFPKLEIVNIIAI
jgi:hypothetical protein